MKAFKTLYFIVLFFALTGSNLLNSAIPTRMIFSIILFVMCVYYDRGIALDSCFKWYLVFIFFFGLSSIINCHWGTFYNFLLRYYFISFVCWRSTILFIKNDSSATKKILLFILLLGGFNLVVTISQFLLSWSWFEPIQNFLKLPTAEYFEGINIDRLANSDVLSMFLPGIFGNAIINGYFLAICVVLSSYYFLVYKKIIFFILPVSFLFGSFVCQERAPFVLAIFMLLFIVYKSLNNLSVSYKIALFAIILIAAIYGSFHFINISDVYNLRYTMEGMTDIGRTSIYRGAIEYLKNNFLFPHIDDIPVAPHNIFLNAFVYGGLFSFISIMAILFIQAKTAFKVLSIKIDKNSVMFLIFVCAWGVFTVNGFVHNRSIVTGEIMAWILWALMSSTKPSNC